MKTKKMTTEQMVRKCFCETIRCGESCHINEQCDSFDFSKIARAARRFVKMEQATRCKKFLDDIKKRARNKEGVKLPKHWGEIK